MKRKRHEANKAFEKKSRINEKKIFEVGYRVQTPYGIGTVLASTKNKYNSEGDTTTTTTTNDITNHIN